MSTDDVTDAEYEDLQARDEAREPDECNHLVMRRCTYPGSTGPTWICADDGRPECHHIVEDAPLAAPEPSSVLPEVQPGERAGEAQDGRTTAEWISDLVKARQAAEAEVERLGSVVRDYGQQAITKANEHAAVAAERDALAVKLARAEAALMEVQAVADRRDPTSAPHETDVATARAMGRVNGIDWAVGRVRAALADAASPSGLDDDAPTEVQQADEAGA